MTGLRPAPGRRRATTRLGLSLFVILLALLAAAYAVRGSVSEHEPAFITAAVARGDIEDVVSSVGKIQPRAYVDVGAQASGQLRKILVRIGDQVTAGQRLAEIDPQVQNAKLEADRAELARLQATLAEQQAMAEFAQSQLTRTAELIPQNAISRSSYDESRRDAKTSVARVDAIRAQIQQMQSTLKADELALGYTRIDAPMAGTVVSIDAREGQTLNANYSAPSIMRIADLATMTIWTQVSEADVTRLRDGMEVYFTTLGHGDRRWRATLRQILPAPQRPDQPASGQQASAAASPSTNNVVLYVALFDIENTQGVLRPEMTAQVSFVTAFAKDAILVPATALKASRDSAPTEGDVAEVEVDKGGGQFERRHVRVGVRTRFSVQILDGLAVGERVVVGVRRNRSGPSLVRFLL